MKTLHNLFKNKKAINMLESWVEFFFFLVMIIGFVVSLSANNAAIGYAVIIFSGFMCGRFLYQRQKGLPFYVIFTGFLIGYLLGVQYASRKTVFIVFIIISIASYFVHKKKLI